MKRNITAAAAAILIGTAFAAQAQYATNWYSMAVAGSFQGWNNWPNMGKVSNTIWEGTFFVSASNHHAFKFIAEQNWNNDFGETNQVAFEVPMHGWAVFRPGYGKDIVLSNAISGMYRFRFCESNNDYWVDFLYPVSANYGRMTVAGDQNGWSTSPNMELVSNYTWQADLYVRPMSRFAFKFVADENWATDFGQTNQTSYVLPLTGTGALNPPDGIGDIVISNMAGGIYRFVFNDSSRVYNVTFLQAGVANYSSMGVAGNFNGWSSRHNMTLISNYTWEGSFTFSDRGTINFKFVANDSWGAGSWGVSNQINFGAPIAQTGDVVSGSGNDITLNGPLDGRYFFRFNDNTRYFEAFPDGMWENFDAWPVTSSYGIYSNATGWLVYSGMLHYTYTPRYGLSARMRDSPVEGQYIRTPWLADGVVQLSFWYRHWDGLLPKATYEVQSSTNGADWVTNGIVIAENTNYTRYVIDYDITNGVYLRVYHNGGGKRVVFDDFVVVEPFARVVIDDVTLTPQRPGSNESVKISALVVTNKFATNLVAQTYYRVGTTGPFASIGMSGTTNWLSTTSNVPGQTPGTIVYYYIQASFGGRGGLSPVYWPSEGSNNPASYGVPRNKWGTIWVNEVSYDPDWYAGNNATNEFIELCGLAKADIGDWTIELLDLYVPYVAYTIANNTILPNDGDGFGFWVLGDSVVTNVNMVFTNILSGQRSMAQRGAIRLKNELGMDEYILTYGDPAPSNFPDATYIGWDDNFWFDTDPSLALIGTGSNYLDLAWDTNDVISPGWINALQFLSGGNEDPLPLLTDVAIKKTWQYGSQVTLLASGTNGWLTQPFYSTVLLNPPSGWTPISSYNSTYSGGTNTITFSRPSGVTNVFYRVQSTRSW